MKHRHATQQLPTSAQSPHPPRSPLNSPPPAAPLRAPSAPAGAPAPAPRAAQLTGSQLLALVPNRARPWVPYNARACTTQAARQQVVLLLAGSYLALLVRELRLAPDARAKEVGSKMRGAGRARVGDEM